MTILVDFFDILQNGVTITSSGTTGKPKSIFRTPENLKKVCEVAINAQQITKKSKILTVTRMTHAGGLLTQSLPGYMLGCDIKIQQFNAYSFLKDFKDYTHTFLTPAHMWALMQTRDFAAADLSGKWILGGSDPVSWEMIEAFTEKGAKVQPNWGMSEVGPIAINTLFDSIEKVMYYKSLCPPDATILGDVTYCDVKLVNDELFVKGNISIYDDWYATKDKVITKNGIFFYQGRTNKEIDL
jgi:acyl-CoA synthetase (AMP-forming)/AMP-acid ligase II